MEDSSPTTRHCIAHRINHPPEAGPTRQTGHISAQEFCALPIFFPFSPHIKQTLPPYSLWLTSFYNGMLEGKWEDRRNSFDYLPSALLVAPAAIG